MRNTTIKILAVPAGVVHEYRRVAGYHIVRVRISPSGVDGRLRCCGVHLAFLALGV